MGYYNQPQQVGERFDGRLLFHDRRHQVHLEIIKWSTMAVKDPKYLGEWCASLMALHRMLWGSLEKIKVPFAGKEVLFNPYMESKLRILNQKIIGCFTYIERAGGEVYIKTNREQLKGMYLQLDKAQKEIASIEYKKNLDLPKKVDPVEDCTTGGM